MNLKVSAFIYLFILSILVYDVDGQSVQSDKFQEHLDMAHVETSKTSLPSATPSEGNLSNTDAQLKRSITSEPEIDQGTNPFDLTSVRLKNKIIPLDNTVYQFIEYFETEGYLGFIPQAKPYTKIFVAKLLTELLENKNLSARERKNVQQYFSDIIQDTNGLKVYKQASENTFALAGFSAQTSARSGAGDNGTWGVSLIGEPFLSGDLGEHLTFTAGMGLALERLSPDIFYKSYTRSKQVIFPYESIGYSYLPYQFNFETMYAHVLASGTTVGGGPVKADPTAGMIYHSELNGSWFDGAVQFSYNNQRRAWGNDQSNLVLSSSARRFPAIELKIQPAKWIRYSYLTGSLFSFANQNSNYREQVYDYDLGQVQKMFTYHLLEITPSKWLQISAGGGNVWSKRLELAYLMPFVLPHFTQIDVGDHDNLSMNFDVATLIPGVGKIWGSFFVDEFNFTQSGKLMKMPRNRYAWQVGWRSNFLSGIIPGTTSTIKYTRLTPFVYTHYPDSTFNTFGDRPNDMTYTHDEFNLGFYLPPNSGELNWKLENIAIPDLFLSLDNRLIIHGTNDLASSNIYQIYGDVYRHQIKSTDEDLNKYPLTNFTKDGIYDWSVMSEFKFDLKLRNSGLVTYYRLVGSLGYSKTWWKSNESMVVAPESKSLLTGSIGIILEM